MRYAKRHILVCPTCNLMLLDLCRLDHYIQSCSSSLRMVSRMVTAYRVRFHLSLKAPPMPINIHRLGATISSAYTLTFQTQLFSILPPSFSRGFKALVASTIPPSESDSDSSTTPSPPSPHIWAAFETLGLLDRYESIVASVGYEHIEAHVLATCTGQWEKPMLEGLRAWMSDKIVAWMLAPYARGASNGESVCYY